MKIVLPRSFLRQPESTVRLQLSQKQINSKVITWMNMNGYCNLFNILLHFIKLRATNKSSNNYHVHALSYLKHRCMLWSLISVWCHHARKKFCIMKRFYLLIYSIPANRIQYICMSLYSSPATQDHTGNDPHICLSKYNQWQEKVNILL